MISQLPTSHATVFRYLTAFLRELLKHSAENKLDPKMLGMYFYVDVEFLNVTTKYWSVNIKFIFSVNLNAGKVFVENNGNLRFNYNSIKS